MNKKGYLAIVLGITGDWAFAAGTILCGLKRHMKIKNYDVVIYNQNLDEKDAHCLSQIHSCVFKPYKFRRKDVAMDKFKRLSEMTFSRFECFDLLDEYENIVWIDADALVLHDLSEMTNDVRNGIGMYLHQDTPISVSFSHSVPGYNMQEECFNAGIIVVNNSLEKRGYFSEWCYEKTAEYSEYINSDQAIVNLMLQEFNLKPTILDIKYNCPPDSENEDTAILHPWGNNKFWNNIYHPVWEEYFKEWVKLGGSSQIVQDRILRCFKIFLRKVKRTILK